MNNSGWFDMMQRVQNEAFGRQNRAQEVLDKEEARQDLMEEQASFELNSTIDDLANQYGVDQKRAIAVVDKVWLEIKKFYGMGNGK